MRNGNLHVHAHDHPQAHAQGRKSGNPSNRELDGRRD